MTFKNRNKEVFKWDAEDDLNKLMGDSSPVNHPNILAKFPGVLLESGHIGPTSAVHTPVVDNNAAAAGAAANAGIHKHADDPKGDQHPPLTVDCDSS